MPGAKAFPVAADFSLKNTGYGSIAISHQW